MGPSTRAPRRMTESMADKERQDRVAALQRRRVERSPSPGSDMGRVAAGPAAKGTRSVRRHAAPVGRVIAAGFSVTATLALLAGMGLGDRVAADHSSTTVSTGEDGATEQAGGSPPPAAAPPTPEEIVRVVRRKIYVEVPVDSAGVSSLRVSGSQGLAASPSRSARPSTSPAGVAAPAAPAPAPRPAPVTKSRAS